MDKKEFEKFVALIIILEAVVIFAYLWFEEGFADFSLLTKTGMINLIITAVIGVAFLIWKQNYTWFRKYITPKPYLKGTWTGGIKRETEQFAQPFLLTIKQDFFSIKCETISSMNNKSSSYSSQLFYDEDSTQLLYNWEGVSAESRSKFSGVTDLTFDPENKVLSGKYHSQQFSGLLYLQFSSKKIETSFDPSLFSQEFIDHFNQKLENPVYE